MDLTSRLKRVKYDFGKAPLCNGRCERGPHIKGFYFPLCWRCLSIVMSVSFCCVFNLIYPLEYTMMNIPILASLSSLLLIPLFIDGLMQYVFKRESTNLRRIITGFFAGMGIWLLANLIQLIILEIK